MSKNKKIDVKVDTKDNSDSKLAKLTELFVDEYKNPIILSPTQKQIFTTVAKKTHSRVGIITPTQYGKSLSVALGVIIRAITLPENFIIIGGTKGKAEIIMGYIIDHLFDNNLFLSQLKVEGGKLEQLRRERKREHLTFKRGGEIKIMSAEARNRRRIGESLIGEGGKNIIIDDSVLIEDDTYAYIKRMVGGRKDTFILELSNPLKRNHFFRTMTSDKRYHKIWIDWQVAVNDGRFSQEFIDEMRETKFFDVFYECKFPDSDVIDDKGYIRLLSDEQIENAITTNLTQLTFDNNKFKMGVDVGRGGNRNVICLRSENMAIIYKADKVADLMVTTGTILDVMKKFKIEHNDVMIDDTGVGAGIVDRLKEQRFFVQGVKFGEKSKNEKDFANIKAECFWNLREWILKGGKIDYNDNLLNQLRDIRYKINSSGKIQMESKEEMAMRGVESPDEADALALTFANENKMTVDRFQRLVGNLSFPSSSNDFTLDRGYGEFDPKNLIF